MQEFSDFVLSLYQLSRETSLSEFQDVALSHLKQALAFDSSMWGTAKNTPQGIDVHTLHLHEQPADMIEAYSQIKHLDTAAREVGTRPRSTLGFSAADWFSAPEQAPLRAYGRRFDQANFFITSQVNLDTQFVHWLTLFRAREKDVCTEAERDVLAALSPHVMQALSFNRISHLDQLRKSGVPHRGHAVSDMRGALYHADANFDGLLRAEWAAWRGGDALPAGLLLQFERGHQRHVGERAVFWHVPQHGLLFLGARERTRADTLSPREHVVARMVAQGRTHKEIARVLDRSPATIRNQIQAIYGKLEVGNVASLIEILRASE